MRIGVNTLSVTPGRTGGGETYLGNLVRALAPLLSPTESLDLLVHRGNVRLFQVDAPRVSRVLVPVPGGWRPWRLAAEHLLLPVIAAARGVDVLLSPGNAVPPLAGVRHVLALQSMHYRFIPEQMSRARVLYFQRMVPLSAARATRVVCMSRDLERALLRVSPRSSGKTRVIHEGADLSAFRPVEGAPGEGGYFLYVSSLNRFKRPDTLVRALGLLRREGSEPPPLKLAGRPDPEDRARVEALAREEGVRELVEVLGVQTPSELRRLYHGAIALLYPSAIETFGLPPLEAMACDCPVLAADRTSIPEVVGDAGLLVDPDDVPAVAAAMRRLLTDGELRTELRRRGRENVRRFSWHRAARETLEEIREAALA